MAQTVAQNFNQHTPLPFRLLLSQLLLFPLLFPYRPFPSSQSFQACLFLYPWLLHPTNLTHPTPRHARVSQGSQFPRLLSDHATACEKKFAWEGNTDLRYRREKHWGPPQRPNFCCCCCWFFFKNIFSRQILIRESHKIERAEHQNKILYFCSASHKHKRKIPQPSILFGDH